MSFADLENEALDSDNANLSNLLSIAWANVRPGLVADDDVDAVAMHTLRTLLTNDDCDCDAPSRQWLAAHHVMPLAA